MYTLSAVEIIDSDILVHGRVFSSPLVIPADPRLLEGRPARWQEALQFVACYSVLWWYDYLQSTASRHAVLLSYL